jgi:hypothetical protein
MARDYIKKRDERIENIKLGEIDLSEEKINILLNSSI